MLVKGTLVKGALIKGALIKGQRGCWSKGALVKGGAPDLVGVVAHVGAVAHEPVVVRAQADHEREEAPAGRGYVCMHYLCVAKL